MSIVLARQKNILKFLAHPFWDIHAVSDHALADYDWALTHDSFAKEQQDRGIACEHYERLEFLGDRILNHAVAEFLFQHYPDAEGVLSDKIQVTKNDNLAKIVKARKLGIQPPLVRLGKGQSLEDSTIADVFEALMAAIYLDPAQGMAKVQQIIAASLAEDVFAFNAAENYIKQLNEYVQNRFRKGEKLSKAEFDYAEVDRIHDARTNTHTFCIEVRICNQPWGRGCGSNITEAKQAAAREALSRLAGHSPV